MNMNKNIRQYDNYLIIIIINAINVQRKMRQICLKVPCQPSMRRDITVCISLKRLSAYKIKKK